MPIVSFSLSEDDIVIIDSYAAWLCGSRSSALRYILASLDNSSSALPGGAICGTKEHQPTLPLPVSSPKKHVRK